MWWLRELQGVTDAFAASDTATYLYDEGEQGQPCFLFQRRGDQSFLSIVDSRISMARLIPLGNVWSFQPNSGSLSTPVFVSHS